MRPKKSKVTGLFAIGPEFQCIPLEFDGLLKKLIGPVCIDKQAYKPIKAHTIAPNRIDSVILDRKIIRQVVAAGTQFPIGAKRNRLG